MSSYSTPIRDGLREFLSDHPKLRAILVGTRRTDPHASSLQSFSPTDHGWPDFMRVNPILDWEYRLVWAYLLEVREPYCILYDQG